MSENPSDRPALEGDDLAPAVEPAAPAVLPAPPSPPTGTGTPAAPRLRDRVFRLRSVLAVAAAGVIVGGAAGAGLTAVADGHGDRRPGFGRFGPGQAPGMSGGMPGMPGRPGFGGGRMPGMQGQVPQGVPQGQVPEGQVPQAQPSAGKSS